MWQYWSHFKYIIIHKWYVFLECYKKGIIWRGITHDLSKFRPSEFIAYSNYFFHKDGTRRNLKTETNTLEWNEKFQLAWCHHQNRNDHHWNYWVIDQHNESNNFDAHGGIVAMSPGAMMEMVCDMRGAAKARGTEDAAVFYKKHRERIILHPTVRRWVDIEFGVEKV